MDDYLKKVKESSGIENLNICPFLFYSLTPYIVTFAKGGWFAWVKHRNLSYRKTIDKSDFKKKNVNILYPNEVLVCCPNPVFNVVCGIGPWQKDKIKIRVLSADNLCFNHHKAGEEFVLDEKSAYFNALQFNQEFPRKLLCAFNDRLQGEKKKNDFCSAQDKLQVKISRIIHACRYHKDKRNLNSSILPEGLCIHLFQAIYPYVLALMYDARVEKEFKIDCPVGECSITVSLLKTPSIKNIFVRMFRLLIKKIFDAFFTPLDLIDYNLTINIIDIKNKPQGCQLEKSKSYPVNLKSQDFICPASFHVLYPFLLLAASGQRIAWDENEKDNRASCPDCVGIIYSLHES